MNELLNGTMAEAVEKLAAYAVALRKSPRTAAEKAASASDFLASVGSQFKQNPTLGSSLAGAGVGAGLGGVSTALGNRGKDPSQKRGLVSSMLTGGLAGAGIGAGVSMAHRGLEGVKGRGTGMGHDALKPGEFTVPGPDGTPIKMRIDPKALKDNPDLHRQVKALTTPNMQSTVAGGVGAAWDQFSKAAPTSASVLPYAAGADALWHGAGLGSINPGQASGGVGKELLRQGIPKLEESAGVASMMNQPLGGTKPAFNSATGGWTKGRHISLADNVNPSGWLGRQVDAVKGKFPRLLGRPNTPTLGDALGGRGGAGGGSRTVASIEHTPIEVRETETPIGTGGAKEKSKVEHVMPAKTETINEKMVSDAKRFGADEHPYYKGRRLYRGPFGTYSGAASVAGGLGRRAAVVAPLVAGEYLARGMKEDVQNKQTLRELMQQHAKPIPEGK